MAHFKAVNISHKLEMGSWSYSSINKEMKKAYKSL